jgi:hypothetical protein
MARQGQDFASEVDQQIVEKRKDKKFMRRIRKSVRRDRKLLERLR